MPLHTYRRLFRTPEFAPFIVSLVLQNAATALSGLATATLVYRQTQSPLLSALAMFGPALAQLLGASTLLSAADRLPPKAAIIGTTIVFAITTAIQAVPGLPTGVAFAVLFVQGIVASLAAGVRLGLLHEILPPDGFVLGRSVTSIAASGVQILGYMLGAGLVLLLTPRATLILGAALFAGSALVAAFLSERAARISGSSSIGTTWRLNRRLLGSRSLLPFYLALWVPNGLIVGAESLFVSLEPQVAGVLFACAAAGSLLGSVVVGRFLTAYQRARLGAPLRLLLAVPYLFFVFALPLPLAAVVVFAASIGFAASLVLQEQLMERTPPEYAGHTLGLVSSGTLAMQGISAVIAGGLAQATSPTVAMTLVAAASVAVTLALASVIRAPAKMTPGT
ncbi:MFS transporter [Agromyces sp. Marseille-Q5079]|uniref:MFS transporter n=1 Tax=Agromyces sp. Marseille-Q5079 TaxID=3439059 RepID=UPI003D9CA36A